MKCERDNCDPVRTEKRVVTDRATYDECARCQYLVAVISKKPRDEKPRDERAALR